MRTDSAGTRPHALARGPVLGIAGAIAALQLTLASVSRRWFDEDLMLAIGRHHLDWGSVDQPPITPLLALLADTIAPGSGLVLALPAVLATALTVVVTALIAREIGGDVRAQTLAALAAATGLHAPLFGHLLTPYSLEPAIWGTLVWLLLRWTRLHDDRLLLLAGVVAGIGAQTKLQTLALVAVTVFAIAITGPRLLLTRPALWGGGAIAALIATPTLLWQATNGWPQLAMAAAVSEEVGVVSGGRIGTAVLTLVLAGPLGLGLIAVGLVGVLRTPGLRDIRFLALVFVILYAAFVATAGRQYYLAGLYGPVAAVGAVVLQRSREEGRPRRTVAMVATTGVSVVLVAATCAASLWLHAPLFGDAVARTTADAYRNVPAEQRDRTVVMTQPFTYAVFIDAAPPELGLPPASSPNRAYGWFPPPPDTSDHVLFVGDPRELLPWFTNAVLVSRVEGSPPAPHLALAPPRPSVWLLSGQRQPWSAIWPRLRSLRVIPDT